MQEVACPNCEEKGCELCHGRGRFEIEGCPQQMVDRELADCLRPARLYEKGLPPVMGGSLDQANWFVEMAECYWSERAQCRAELGIPSEE